MSIIRKIIKRNDDVVRFKIPIHNKSNNYGEHQEINELTSLTGNNLINPAIDGDVKLFKPYESNTINVNFWNGTTFEKSYNVIDFTLNDIQSSAGYVLNSFYFIDFYDNINLLNQIKLFRVFINKFNFTNTIESKILIDLNNNREFNNWYIPNKLGTQNILNVYARFNFYNSKNGQIITFRYDNEDGLMFVPCEIDLINKKWRFETSNFNIYQLISNTYNDKMNNTVNNLNNLRQNPPQGSIFDYQTISYRNP